MVDVPAVLRSFERLLQVPVRWVSALFEEGDEVWEPFLMDSAPTARRPRSAA